MKNAVSPPALLLLLLPLYLVFFISLYIGEHSITPNTGSIGTTLKKPAENNTYPVTGSYTSDCLHHEAVVLLPPRPATGLVPIKPIPPQLRFNHNPFTVGSYQNLYAVGNRQSINSFCSYPSAFPLRV